MSTNIVKMPDDPKKFTGRDVINMSKGDIELTYGVVGKYVFDENGRNLSPEEGFEYLIDLDMYEFEKIMDAFNKAAMGDNSPN